MFEPTAREIGEPPGHGGVITLAPHKLQPEGNKHITKGLGWKPSHVTALEPGMKPNFKGGRFLTYA